MTEHIYYFAYGSNMSVKRIQARVPSAQKMGVYFITEHQLNFAMHGFDDSGKCDAHHTQNPNHKVYGVVYKMDARERYLLDIAENVAEGGYAIKNCLLQHESQPAIQGFLYYAKRLQQHLKPYDWYKHHVHFGAQEAGLPQAYIAQYIEAVDAIEDADHSRKQQQLAIYDEQPTTWKHPPKTRW